MENFNIQIQPLTESSSLPLQTKEHICLGISPFNSLFSEEYIFQLIRWSKANFERFHLFLPDEPTLHTLEALGHGPDEARRKMKKQINWLRNKIHKALEKTGLGSDREKYLLDWSVLPKNPHFQAELEKVILLFDTNSEFREECLEASKWVLQNKLEDKDLTQDSLLKAVKYFLSEIPLFGATNKIVGTSTSLFCYHQSIGFHHKLYRQQLPYRSFPGQGFGLISY